MRDWKPEIERRLTGLRLDPARAEEIVTELAEHLDQLHADALDAGASEEDASRAAQAELESGDVLRDAIGRVEGPAAAPDPVLGAPSSGGWRNGLSGDVRYGVRSLLKSPGLTTVALVTLALGIGANAALFSVVNAVLLRPLPFAEPDRLVSIWGTAPQMGIQVLNYPEALYVYFRTRSHALEKVAAYEGLSTTLTGAGEPTRLTGASVTADFFPLLGRAPLLGRTFLAEEEQRDRNDVVVLSHGLWQRRFGSDPGIVGKALTLDGRPTTVVGIMPSGFDFPDRAELWRPIGTNPQSLDCWCYSTLGRLATGRTPADASAEIALLIDDFWREHDGKPPKAPEEAEAPKWIVFAVPLAQNLVGSVRTPLLVLLGAVGMVLLIACANVANLLLARATARRREIALRGCLGASPWRIVRQLLVESLMLGLAGSAIGLGLAFWAVRALGGLVVERLSHVGAVGLDAPVLLFTFGVTLATVVLFGLAPALRGARADLQDAVKEGARGARGGRSRRLTDAFVVAQLALSLVLLIGAGLLLRSFRNLLEVDLGFRPESVLVGRVSPPPKGYDEIRSFYGQLEERLRALPGVRAVGLTTFAPFAEGDDVWIFRIKGREPAPGQPDLVARIRTVTPDYFAAVGTTVVRGRLIDDTDGKAAPAVVLVDETLARRFWPDGNAVGKELRFGNATSTNPWLTIVGVVRNVKHGSVSEDPTRYVYIPLAQTTVRSMDFVLRAAGEPALLTAAIRREVQALDPNVPLYQVDTLEHSVARSLGTQRLTNDLLLAFAVTAMLLAAVGIYGVMALGVGQRVNEFGIRLALGAAPRDVLALVLRQGMRLVLLGVVVGVAGAMALTRFLGSLLFHVEPVDPLTFGAVALVLLVVAAAACYLPARRATATDPLEALRYE